MIPRYKGPDSISQSYNPDCDISSETDSDNFKVFAQAVLGVRAQMIALKNKMSPKSDEEYQLPEAVYGASDLATFAIESWEKAGRDPTSYLVRGNPLHDEALEIVQGSPELYLGKDF